MKVKVGDAVVVKQLKTTTQPPWDPKPFKVTEVKGTKLFLEKGGKSKVKSLDKCKLVKLPPHTPTNPYLCKLNCKINAILIYENLRKQ